MTKGRIRILLIEDSHGDARLISEMLGNGRPENLSLEHSDTLSDGLEKLGRQPFDAIFLDINLPDSDGIGAIPGIKKLAPSTPIVMLTGLDDEDTAVSALHLGVQDYLVKGQIDGRLLVRSLRYAIERKRMETELDNYHNFLEALVTERTKELNKTNEELEKEIAVRRETSELLERVFSNIYVLIAYMDRDFNFIKVNRTYAEADGRNPDFYIGKNHFSLFPNEENEAIFRNVLETGKPYFVYAKPFAYAGNPERGVTYWDWSLFPVKGADRKVQGLLLSLVNVTDNVLLQAESMRASQLASVGELAAGVAHEINNPVNGIINYAQILLNKFDAGSKEHEVAERIIKEGDRITGIVSSLLSFSRKGKGEKELVGIQDVLQETLYLTEAVMRKDGIKLKVDVPKGLPPVNINIQQIQQVFLNLISNARYALNEKYPSGSENKALEIRGETVALDGSRYLRLAFHDNGTGIPSDLIDKITIPFFTTKPRNKGTGLGLSISHGIIGKHTGRLMVESLEGEFTKITVDLPVGK